ncbi:MAG: hypothetical protein M1371_00585 [Actinobacteria bacterium]|nr:hypothetical protein [Actinomycetota bacterium]MCL5985043.1 hypothetical protein [Actinomycetota bacterium]
MRRRNKKGQFAPTVLTESNREEIIFKYKKGFGLKKLASSYHTADDRLKKHLYLHNWQNLNKFKEIGFSLSRKQGKVIISLSSYRYTK